MKLIKKFVFECFDVFDEVRAYVSKKMVFIRPIINVSTLISLAMFIKNPAILWNLILFKVFTLFFLYYHTYKGLMFILKDYSSMYLFNKFFSSIVATIICGFFFLVVF